MSSVLTLQKITRTYHQGENTITPLADFSLEIKKGESVALVGPSGSGKSTLLQIAGLLDNPTSGEVMIGGENMSKAGDAARTQMRRSQLGFVYQFHHLLPEFSALENVMLPQMMAGVAKSKAAEKAASLLDALGLAERRNHRPARLSGGEQQRVAIARALANHPRVILADEPTGNLDSQTSNEIMDLFTELNARDHITIVVVTHEPDIAQYAKRLVKFKDGILVYDGPVTEEGLNA